MSTLLETDSGLSPDKSVKPPLVLCGIPKQQRRKLDLSFQRTQEPLQHALSLQMVSMLELLTRAMITWSVSSRYLMAACASHKKVAQTLL
tara:strand:+ start:679 stop:948 length:270 start_codon:yes stop_codon:yes gene_type:complete